MMDPEKYKAQLEKARARRLAYMKQWHKAQKQRREVNAQQRRLREQHKRQPKVRAGRLGATVVEDFSQAKLDKRMALFGNLCVYCSGPFQHIDHIVPVAIGGKHALWNLAPSCRPCNTSKADSDPVDWVSRRAINKTALLVVERAMRRHTRSLHA